MSTPGRKRHIAILGGGQAALTAALQLTDPQNPAAADHEVTIYQLGWRLGGKGATGRPEGVPRILEHGLHNWFGFYDNSFRQMREVYTELNRPAGAPLATFDEAFQGADAGSYVEWIEGQALPWEVINTPNSKKPGEGGLWEAPLQHVAAAMEMLEGAYDGSSLGKQPEGDDHLLARIRSLLHDAGSDPGAAHTARHLLHLATATARAAADGVEHPLATHLDRIAADLEHDVKLPHWIKEIEDLLLRPLCWLLWLFMTILRGLTEKDIETVAKTDERRLWIVANLGYSCITGAIRDDVIADGFNVLNDRDLRTWLDANQYPDDGVMLRSPLIEAVYCGSFAYPRGDTHGPRAYPPTENMEAGTAFRGIVRTLLTYKGSFAYRFAAGTADTCYAPAYEVLRARGVTVRFFARVRRVELDADAGAIARVHIGEQAQITGETYEPLIDVAGLPCWPLHPQWAQLTDGDELREQGADFEFPSAELEARERPLVLERGADFDDVVLGISTAALRGELCHDLADTYPAWATALDEVKTVRTQSLQLWLSETPAQLGFTLPDRPITNWRYDDQSPLDVWGDFSELIAMEHWPAANTPASLHYLCSTMPDDPAFTSQAAANADVKQHALDMLHKGVGVLMPQALDANGEFRWDLIVDPDPGADGPSGPDRLDTQWIRGNVAPTERYVLSVVNSSKHRLPVHDAATVTNLYLAGDWTECTLNCGCMEAATMSGMLSANALCGYPPRDAIVGVDF
ncbi:MAG: NAD(P)-binding protein [Solirubrobacteraceae bacterium]|nr:NAD(P)-binding protein [Solirubrobacteraceae bacterium]